MTPAVDAMKVPASEWSPGKAKLAETPFDIACLGILVADIVVRPVDKLPHSGRLELVDEIVLRSGGSALNTATVLSHLGLRVMLSGKVGSDPFGRFLLEATDANGLRREGVTVDAKSQTSATVALVDTRGERSFLHCLGADGTLEPADINRDWIFSGCALHIGGALALPKLDGQAMAEILAEGRRRGLLTSVDSVWDDTGNWRRIDPCLRGLDIFAPSLAEAREITGQDDPRRMATALHELGVRDVAIKLGPAGSFVSGDDFQGYIETVPVRTVDGTGAGDAFVAGLLYGKLARWSLAEAARLGNAAGALAVTALGATEAFRDIDGVAALVATLEECRQHHESSS